MKFILGIVIGVLIAVGAILLIQNKGIVSQFVPQHEKTDSNSSNKLDSSSPLILAPGIKKMQKASEVTTQIDANQTAESEQIKSYDFYDVLEGKKNLNESTVTTNTSQKKTVAIEPKIYVQIGAYSDPDEANNMKARLILMDIDAKIISAPVGDKLFNKVIVGPFQNTDDARKAQSAIQEQGISAIITNI